MSIRHIVSNRLRNRSNSDEYDGSNFDKFTFMIFENFKFEPNHHEIQRNLTGPEGGLMTGLKT